jgi:hypothetical protein
MAKFKPKRAKSKGAPRPQGGLPCAILIIAGVVLLMLFLYWILASTK